MLLGTGAPVRAIDGISPGARLGACKTARQRAATGGFLIYRAQLDSLDPDVELPDTLRFFPLDDLPIEQMPVNELRSVVRRYARERKNQQFGIYTGSAASGRVEMIENATPPYAALAHESL